MEDQPRGTTPVGANDDVSRVISFGGKNIPQLNFNKDVGMNSSMMSQITETRPNYETVEAADKAELQPQFNKNKQQTAEKPPPEFS